MADGKNRKPDAAKDTPRNEDGANAKSPGERGASAAKTGNAQGEKAAALKGTFNVLIFLSWLSLLAYRLHDFEAHRVPSEIRSETDGRGEQQYDRMKFYTRCNCSHPARLDPLIPRR